MSFPKSKHYKITPGGSGSSGGGGVPGGASNEIQKNNGAAAFAGTGETNPAAAEYRVETANTRYIRKNLPSLNALNSGSSLLLDENDWADGESMTAKVIWTAKDDSSNTGAGGLFITAWTKAAGVIQKVFDNDTLKGSDTLDTLDVISDTSGNNIVVTIDNNVAVDSNFSCTWHAEIVIRRTV